jgi:hypothetical protein
MLTLGDAPHSPSATILYVDPGHRRLERRDELGGLPGLTICAAQRSAVAETARIAGHKPPQ